jgi:hypothetical protein
MIAWDFHMVFAGEREWFQQRVLPLDDCLEPPLSASTTIRPPGARITRSSWWSMAA